MKGQISKHNKLEVNRSYFSRMSTVIQEIFLFPLCLPSESLMNVAKEITLSQTFALENSWFLYLGLLYVKLKYIILMYICDPTLLKFYLFT